MYTTSCLTQVTYLECGSETFLLTASTDGHICLWHTPFIQRRTLDASSKSRELGQFDLVQSKAIHQSTIKSFDAIQLGGGHFIIGTVGDDNALAFSLLAISQETTANPQAHMETILIPDAHAAAATAIVLWSGNTSRRDGSTEEALQVIRAVTSGTDQRLRVWTVEINPGRGLDGVTVSRTSSAWTSVADVSDIAQVPFGAQQDAKQSRQFLLCGVGLEVWEFEES
jgi:hypothetical protein